LTLIDIIPRQWIHALPRDEIHIGVDEERYLHISALSLPISLCWRPNKDKENKRENKLTEQTGRAPTRYLDPVRLHACAQTYREAVQTQDGTK